MPNYIKIGPNYYCEKGFVTSRNIRVIFLPTDLEWLALHDVAVSTYYKINRTITVAVTTGIPLFSKYLKKKITIPTVIKEFGQGFVIVLFNYIYVTGDTIGR